MVLRRSIWHANESGCQGYRPVYCSKNRLECVPGEVEGPVHLQSNLLGGSIWQASLESNVDGEEAVSGPELLHVADAQSPQPVADVLLELACGDLLCHLLLLTARNRDIR